MRSFALVILALVTLAGVAGCADIHPDSSPRNFASYAFAHGGAH